MNMVDVVFRRFGVAALVLTLPGLALPIFAVVQNGIGEVSVAQMILIGLGLAGAFGIYGVLVYFTWRAFRGGRSSPSLPARWPSSRDRP